MSFQQGLSGLNATSKSLEVIGNNIANAGTYGAKAARAEFADLYARSLGGANAAGIGVQVANIAQQFSQGGIVSTNNLMDVAINGDGFFQMQDTSGQMLYSRNGQFKLDSDGFIVNGAGHRLLGYPVDNVGNLVTQVRSQLQLPTVGIAPKATEEIKFEMNLDSRKTAVAGAIDYDDPATYHNATSVRIYDAKGHELLVSLDLETATARESRPGATLRALVLGALRRDSHALRHGGLRWIGATEDAVAFVRESRQGSALVVAAREATGQKTVPTALLPGIESGRLALGSGIRVEGNQVVMEAERGGIAVWVW